MKKTLKRAIAVLMVTILSVAAFSTGTVAAERVDEEKVLAANSLSEEESPSGVISEEEEPAAAEPTQEDAPADSDLADTGALIGDEDPAAAQVGTDAPEFSSVDVCKEGVKISWKAKSGITYYRIEKWYSDGRGWVKLKDTNALSYTDADVSSGKTYQYRLSGVSAAGSTLTPSVSKSYTYYAPPAISSTETTENGINVSWTLTAGVKKVALFRGDTGNWKRIAIVTGTSYLDKNVAYSNGYHYTIRALKDDGTYLHDFYDDTGVSAKYLKTPELSVSNAAGGVNISWNSVEGADGYRVFYRNRNGGWSRLATTATTSYLDTDVRSGNPYTYTVRCVSADGENYTSYFNTSGKTVNYVAAPVLVSATATNTGISITWKKSDGAAKYRVFYRNRNGNWAKLGDTSSTSYLDTEVSSGSTYTYTVRCLNALGSYISSYYDAGIKGTYLSPPEITSLTSGENGVDIKWGAVKGAVNYRVYYYGSKGWTKLTETTGTSFTDTDVSSGYTYTYTVRCINADGTEFTSGHLSGKSVKYVAAPVIKSLTNTETGVRITWGAVNGAQKYRVYYRGADGWVKLTDTAATSYLDTSVESGKKYTYTVRCMNADSTVFLSDHKPAAEHLYIAAPDFSVTRNEKTVTISWNKVKGAELYRVYTRNANGWTKLTDTKDTSYEDKSVVSGGTYTYTVRCLNADATACTSDYHAGKALTFVNMPRLKSVYNAPDGVGISWDAVSGAKKYRLYYKGSKGWTKLTDTTGTSFVDTDVASGHPYTYTICCINAAGTEVESTYDSTGKSVFYIAAPKNLKAESYNNSIKISWAHSAGASKYRVYYYGSKGWTKLTETTSNSVIDTDVASGYTYRYTVRCINADGTAFVSDYNHDGVSCKFTTMPVLKSADFAGEEGIKITWGKSAGAEKYRVYYYGSKGWTKLTETTSNSVIDTDVSSGYTYRYTVRCITSDGKSFTSDCDTKGVSLYYCSAPKLVSSDTSDRKVTITWSKPNGASKYRVYKRVNGSWHRQVDTTSNSYSDANVSVGSTYVYTVRVINADGTAFYSGFNPDGFMVTVTSGVSGFVYYDQTKYSYPYGDDTIAGSGCGPTSFAMIASTLTGKSITPVDAVKWCGNSYYVYNVGTMWSYFSEASRRFGITMEKQLGKSEWGSVVSALKQGKYVISSQSSGIFTRGGHFIVLAGITSSGKIIVYDPNGGNNYIGTAFNQSDITASGTQYWVFSD